MDELYRGRRVAGVPSGQMRDYDVYGLSALVLGYSAATLIVPELSPALCLEPTFGAVLTAAALMTLVVVLRARGSRGSALERRALAVFLAAMPSVYIVSLLRHGAGARWLWVELGGQLVFLALAVLGARRSPWILSLGIVAHGLLWDAWHLGRAPFIADWYVVACMILDVAFGLYVATQVRAYQDAAR